MSSPIKAWREQKKISTTLGLKGKIVSWTTVRVPPYSFTTDAPYVVAVVELEDGKRIVGQLIDVFNKTFQTGSKVMAVYRRQKRPDLEGVIYYGLKFKLI